MVTSSGGKFTLTQLTYGDLGTTNLLLKDSVSGFAWIQFSFPQVQTIRAITIVEGGEPGMFGQGAAAPDSRTLEASDDGVNFYLNATLFFLRYNWLILNFEIARFPG